MRSIIFIRNIDDINFDIMNSIKILISIAIPYVSIIQEEDDTYRITRSDKDVEKNYEPPKYDIRW